MTIIKTCDQYEITDTFQDEEVKASYLVSSDGNITIFMQYGALSGSYDKDGDSLHVWGNDPKLFDFSRFFTNLVENVLNYDFE